MNINDNFIFEDNTWKLEYFMIEFFAVSVTNSKPVV